jgi:hypothetical protein
MLLQIVAVAVLLVFLWSLFRFAMGLRWAKLSREEARSAEQARGRRVVAEIPQRDGLLLFLEDADGYSWGSLRAERGAVVGARALLNGGVIASCARPGAALPEPPAHELYEGQERWDVLLYLADGPPLAVPCGTLREGVSREIALSVFEAVRRGVSAA